MKMLKNNKIPGEDDIIIEIKMCMLAEVICENKSIHRIVKNGNCLSNLYENQDSTKIINYGGIKHY